MTDTTDQKKEIARMRELLNAVIGLEEPSDLPELQRRIRAYLHGTDRRRQRTSFYTPEAQAAREQEIEERRRGFAPILRELHGQGASFEFIANTLNEKGIPAPSGGLWSKGSVKFQFDRLPAE